MEINETVNAEAKVLESTKDIADAIVAAVDSKKAKDIKLLQVEDKTVIADYFVICTGTSRTQVRALADEADFILEKSGVECLKTEGYDSGVWVLKDYGGVILHVFSAQARDFYKLEKLYDGTTSVDIADIITD